MATKRIKLKNANGDYLEPYTTNVPEATTSAKGIVQLEATPTASSTKALTSGGAKTALDNKLDKTATAAKATADASGNNIVDTYATKTALSEVETTANTAKSIAEGRARAVSFESYSAMVTALNAAANTDYKVGDNIFIQAKEVPDLWVYSVESTTSSYSYTTDDALISALEAGAVQHAVACQFLVADYGLQPLLRRQPQLQALAVGAMTEDRHVGGSGLGLDHHLYGDALVAEVAARLGLCIALTAKLQRRSLLHGRLVGLARHLEVSGGLQVVVFYVLREVEHDVITRTYDATLGFRCSEQLRTARVLHA